MYQMFGQVYNNPMMFMNTDCCMPGTNINGFDPYGKKALGYYLTTGILGMILNGSFGSSSVNGQYGGGGKSAELTLDQQIEQINSKIKKIDTKLKEPENYINKSFQANIDKNDARLIKLATEITTANNTLDATKESVKKRLTKTNADGTPKVPTDGEINADPAVKAAESALQKLLDEEEKIKGSTAYYKKQKEDAISELEQTLQEEKDKLEEELKKLEAKQENNELSESLNDADGNWFTRLKSTDKAKAQTALHDFRKAQQKWAKGDHSDNVKNQLRTAKEALEQNFYDDKGSISSIKKEALAWYIANILD